MEEAILILCSELEKYYRKRIKFLVADPNNLLPLVDDKILKIENAISILKTENKIEAQTDDSTEN